ncbi:hypothetical protein FHW69_000523 [Luteibacter sp. Sphag1AF]|uniref:hypothetical protein n=1 Tax=Luteibacter sp. Sphag1AF TaxID=2587031 RepID=UPI00160A4D8C|nr:hypothetical protein [Luteibacter sp. Sphag1AF]MBB3225933.1 hypothetical protein [Luteibacter sp. Sphag1AF]
MRKPIRPWGRLAVWAALALLSSAARAQDYFHDGPVPGTLCEPGERIVFSCHTEAKSVAVCARQKGEHRYGALAYRFGMPGHLELSFPEGDPPIASYASTDTRSDGLRGSLSLVRMKNGQTTYTVYYNVVAQSGSDGFMQAGLLVEKNGRLLSKLRCNPDEYVYSGEIYEPGFKNDVPEDTQPVTGFARYLRAPH